MHPPLPFVVLCSCIALTPLLLSPALAVGLEDISLPSGFSISYFAIGLPNARSLSISGSDSRIVYVSTRRLSDVYACVDTDSDGRADAVTTVINDKPTPNGIAWRDGDLYVVTPTSVWQYTDVDQYALAEEAFPPPTLLYSDFPSQNAHAWRYAAFGPDGKLYVAIGADCNICVEDQPFASLQRLDLETLEVETVGRGIRNTVGFAWHPDTKQLWFTDNGRDRMGDNLPDCELNVIPERNDEPPHFGYPFCHTEGNGDPYVRDVGPGQPIADPDLNANGEVDCAQYTEPVQALGPHVAPLGMEFYTGPTFPEEYNRSIFIALHGSWNRNDKIGYQVTRVVVDDNNRAVSHTAFATGWLQGQSSWGRPVDVAMHPEGHLLVSDDAGGAVFRISFRGGDGAVPTTSPPLPTTITVEPTTAVPPTPPTLTTLSPTTTASPNPTTSSGDKEIAGGVTTATASSPLPPTRTPTPNVASDSALPPPNSPPPPPGPTEATSAGRRSRDSGRMGLAVLVAVTLLVGGH